MNGALLHNLEVVLALIAIGGALFATGSFAYSYFYGKLNTAFDHLDRIDSIERTTEQTEKHTKQLSKDVEKQGDILIALTKAHDPDEDMTVDVDSIERHLARKPGFYEYVDKESDD